jgi:uncharacterized protein DUF929
MLAKRKRKQMIRRIAVVVVVVAVITAFAVGIYLATLPTALDKYDGVTVGSSDLNRLRNSALAYAGPSGSDLLTNVRNISSPMTYNNKPLVLYIGADYCPYCAIQRWGLILALMRFGSFTGLTYMTSNADGTDYATFSFHGSTYSSSYISFLGYEVYDRLDNSLDQVPAGYQTPFTQYGSGGFPFVDLAGKYYIAGSLLPSTAQGNPLGYLNGLLPGNNWTTIYSEINNQTSTLGGLIREDANVLTAAICKVATSPPASVCGQPIISGLLTSFDSYIVHKPVIAMAGPYSPAQNAMVATSGSSLPSGLQAPKGRQRL